MGILDDAAAYLVVGPQRAGSVVAGTQQVAGTGVAERHVGEPASVREEIVTDFDRVRVRARR